MKKVMVMCAVLALAVAGSASANYLWATAATDTAGGQAGAQPTMGYQAASTGAQDATVATLAYTAAVILTDPANPGTSAKTALYKKYWWVAPDKNKWYVEVWAGNDFATNIDFRMWVSMSNTTGGTPAARPLIVKCVYDPVGDLEGTVLATGVTTATGGSIGAPKFKYTLPVYRTSTPQQSGCGYILELSVPEPGSMIAVLSGLVGLVGFGIRRRK